MERRILKFKLLIISLFIYGCNSVPEDLVFNDKVINQTNTVSTMQVNKIIEVVPEPVNIWEYLKQKSNYDDVEINEQTLKYMNRHLQNLELFETYLNKSEYFIFHIISFLLIKIFALIKVPGKYSLSYLTYFLLGLSSILPDSLKVITLNLSFSLILYFYQI